MKSSRVFPPVRAGPGSDGAGRPDRLHWAQTAGHFRYSGHGGERRPHPGDAVDPGQGARGRVPLRQEGPARPSGAVLADTATREEAVSPGGGEWRPGGGEFGGDGGELNSPSRRHRKRIYYKLIRWLILVPRSHHRRRPRETSRLT